MKVRLVLCFWFFVGWTTVGISQTQVDSVRTIYSSSLRLHHPTFMKPILPYYGGDRATLILVEDSGTVSLFKGASLNAYSSSIPSFQTILMRSASIGRIQLIGLYDYPDSLRQQFLFWEEGSGEKQRIMYSHCRQDSIWESPRYVSPSLYKQHEIVSTQTNTSTYPRQYSFAIGWNEQDSLTILNFLSDSIISKLRIATNALTDSVRPAISDGMIAWQTHSATSTLRYATFNVSGSILSSDTIPYSQNASYPVFLSTFWMFSQSLCWMKTDNGIGNIIGTSFYQYSSPLWETPSFITNDSSGMNVPISASISPVVTKSTQSTYFHFDYLVFIRTLNTFNAFIRDNGRSYDHRREFWTANTIDVHPGSIVHSAWIERDLGLYTVQYHTGRAYVDAVEDERTLPSKFSLEQNYPNPFNPATTIQYYLPSSGLVTLEIFNVLGRKIITLINSRQSNGPHQVHWDADEFPSGIYFYRLHYNVVRRPLRKRCSLFGNFPVFLALQPLIPYLKGKF